jgi:hypothetical protein
MHFATPEFNKFTADAKLITLRGGRPLPWARRRRGPRAN